MFGALVRVAERWRNIKVTEFERRRTQTVRQELNELYEVDNSLTKPTSKEENQTKKIQHLSDFTV